MSTDSVETDQSRIEPPRLRFRIVHLLYATALIASSLATFGLGGILPAVVFLGGWTIVFLSASRPKSLALSITICLFGCCLCVPGGRLGYPQGAARRMQCSNNLKQIALALHNYHDTYKTFPPAMIPDADGKPMHSWRVLILPFLEQQPLYDRYDFNEPWNGPNNSQFASSMPPVYGCPSHPRSNRTSYVAVIGEHTMWTGTERGVHLRDVLDRTANTILVFEATPAQSNWMEPSDIAYEDALKWLTTWDPASLESGHKQEDFFYERWTGRNTAFADGSVRFLPHALSQDVASAILLRDDDANYDSEKLDFDFESVSRLRLDNCFRLGLFILIVLLPLPWVWRKHS